MATLEFMWVKDRMNEPISSKTQPSSSEALSALKDGEAGEFELRRLLRDIDSEPELKEEWDRFQIIGSVMRGEFDGVGTDISSKVRESIGQEKPARAEGFWKKPLQQFAVAASMAAITLVAVQQFPSSNSVTEELSNMDVADNMYSDEPTVQFPTGIQPPTLSARTVSVSPSPSPSTSSVAIEVATEPDRLSTVLEHYPVNIPTFDENALRRHFDRALFEHSSNAASTAPQSAVPLARVPGLELEEE